MDKIFLCIKRTEDYFNGKIFYDFQRPAMKQVFERQMLLWKLFFKMDYMEFRVRLAQIAAMSYNLNDFDGYFEWVDWEKINKYKDIWILPIDDDDWLHPDILNYLRPLNMGEKKFARWDVITINRYGTIKTITRKAHHGLLQTRSCSFITRFPCADEEFIDGHVKLHYHLKEHPEELLHINKCLAVKIDHWASVASLAERDLKSVLTSAKERVLFEKHELLEGYWHLVDLLNELMIDVYDSFKI